MYPMLRNGEDVVVLKKPEGRLKYLDVALYRRSNGDFVLHRVVGFDKDGKYIFAVIISFIKNGELLTKIL